MITKQHINLQITVADNIGDLSAASRLLVEAAQEASARAYAPYSQFQVGAAIRLNNGKIIEGNNQENAAYPSGLCAERVACFYANSMYPEAAIEAIAICASNIDGFVPNPIPPCGSCRQVLLESEERSGSNIKVILYGTEKIIMIDRIKDLLPIWFDSENLL